MKNNKWLKLIGAAFLGVVILGVAVPNGQTATTVTLTAVVVSQQCRGGDFVDVMFTATIDRHPHGVQYEWDFDNDGVFDTPLSPDPTVIHRYTDETNVTAVVRAVKGARHATDDVTFTTLRCGG